jgi:programmed cell death protein 10
MSVTSDMSTNMLVLSNVFYPVIEQLDTEIYRDLQSDLRRTIYQLEETYPGFARSFLQSFIEKEMPHLSLVVTDMNELTLKLEQFCDKTPAYPSPLSFADDEFRHLNVRTSELKCILSCLPCRIDERQEFLETIKEIASAIKQMLQSVSNIYRLMTTNDARQALEIQKKTLIKSSRHFSDTLKTYFRDNQRDNVYLAANNLLVQTDCLLRTIRFYCQTNVSDDDLYPRYCEYQRQWHDLVDTANSPHVIQQ